MKSNFKRSGAFSRFSSVPGEFNRRDPCAFQIDKKPHPS